MLVNPLRIFILYGASEGQISLLDLKQGDSLISTWFNFFLIVVMEHVVLTRFIGFMHTNPSTSTWDKTLVQLAGTALPMLRQVRLRTAKLICRG